MIQTTEKARLRIDIRGAIQGVGFRPFIFRLAVREDLRGWVNNSAQGVTIEAEGPTKALERFLLSIEKEKPPISFIQSLEHRFLDPVGYADFEIVESTGSGKKSSLILPDIATCDECLREIFDPNDRRYRYPFTNCTNCGPRYSIIRALPYDRPNTTMGSFVMCEACETEYRDPSNRRFHAQPNACPECGPHLELWDGEGNTTATRDDALMTTAQGIREGRIVAVKGLGGFHLMVDARNEEAVARLRELKRREEKPLALMFPSIEGIREECDVSGLENRLLRSPESPIVLLRQTGHHPFKNPAIAPSVAPGNPYIGAMLPYTPLHHLLMAELRFPIVATSGNISDEPICIDEREAVKRLAGIADVFLVHNRPIERHVDDSVARIVAGREMVTRRARGYAPLPVSVSSAGNDILAVGAHLKNTIAISRDSNVFTSQHIGDLETGEALDAFTRVTSDLRRIYDHCTVAIACDLHPDYLSTRFADESGLPVHRIQHHYAHVVSCMAENELEDSVLGVAWDGTGYGSDGTIWGGEFLRANLDSFERFAHFRSFRLPGGDAAIREPRRAALGILHELHRESPGINIESKHLDASFTNEERSAIERMLERGINSPPTTSAGRLFDVVAAFTGTRYVNRFEGQAAMMLEFALHDVETIERYPIKLSSDEADVDAGAPLVVDWAPIVLAILEDVELGEPIGLISSRFHNSMVEAILLVARQAGEQRVVLSGGCFQNAYLTERTVKALRKEGFRPYWHQRFPPNDGGIAPGQAVAAMHITNGGK